MKKQYMKPAISVIRQSYHESFMQTLSLATGTGGATAPADSKLWDAWETDKDNDDSWDSSSNW